MKFKFIKLMLYGAVAVISFCVSVRSIGMLLDRYHLNANNMLQNKIIHLEQFEGKFNIIFAGSSYVYQGIKPKVFTDYLKSYGFNYTGYSLSLAGSYAFETHHYLNILKKFPPQKRPDYIFIDLVPITRDQVIKVMKENKLNNRMIQYHDMNTTYLNIKSILYTNRTPYEKYRVISDHLMHFLYNVANIGMGQYLDNSKCGLNDNDQFIISDNYGYNPKYKGKEAHRNMFTFQSFKDAIKKYKSIFDKTIKNKQEASINKADLMFRTYQAQSMKKINIKVIFVIPPVAYEHNQNEMRALCETENFPPCFLMDDPYKYPELFEYENRWNEWHLNDAGAEYYSMFLAQRFIEYIETGR